MSLSETERRNNLVLNDEDNQALGEVNYSYQ